MASKDMGFVVVFPRSCSTVREADSSFGYFRMTPEVIELPLAEVSLQLVAALMVKFAIYSIEFAT